MSRDIRLQIEYPHPPKKVWRALTDSRAIAEWLMPNDFEPRVGHRFQLRTDPQPGFDGIVHCQVLKIDEPHSLSYTWKGGPIDTIITFDLEPTANGTRLRVTQTGFAGVKANLVRMILKSGSRAIYFNKLPDLLNRMSDDGTWHPAQSEPAHCDSRGGWRIWTKVFSPILGKKGGQ